MKRARPVVLYRALLLLLLLGLAAYARCVIEARHWLEQAHLAVHAAQPERAIHDYRRAISWRAPLNRSAYQALNELYQIGTNHAYSAEVRLEALRALKAGIMSSRSFINTDVVASADDRAARQVLRQAEDQISQLAGPDKNSVQERYPAKLNFSAQILAQIAFWSWITSSFWFIWSAFDQAGRLLSRVWLRKISAPLFSFIIWIICLRFV